MKNLEVVLFWLCSPGRTAGQEKDFYSHSSFCTFKDDFWAMDSQASLAMKGQ